MIVNGDTLSINSLKGSKVSHLLDYYKLNQDHIALEINGAIIKKSDYDKIVLTDDDRIEIIHFVGGGR